ncbi:hypothetical protein J4407_00750 [Candidatus Pacearchaeota archaeon]|nr:hypothetical protein [Candidatus Pacearchaeota archaeon]
MDRKKAPRKLKQCFDKIFEDYCQSIKGGTAITMFAPDNEISRLVLKEFGNYLEQRANFENWEYKPENFQVVYSNQISDLNNEVRLYNPNEKNVGYEMLPGSEVLLRLPQERADRIRDTLDWIRFNNVS